MKHALHSAVISFITCYFTCPNYKDKCSDHHLMFFSVQDFQFRQLKKIRVFGSPGDLPKERSNLLAVSNKYGLTFAGQDRTLKVFLTRDIVAVGHVEANPNEIGEKPWQCY